MKTMKRDHSVNQTVQASGNQLYLSKKVMLTTLTVLIEPLTVIKLIKKHRVLMEPKCATPSSQKIVT
jgi:hypothetical protein